MTAQAREHDDSSDAASTDEPSIECEDDRCATSLLPVWHCVDCDSSYCDDCWSRQGPHKPKKKGRDGVPHEKTNPHVVRRLKAILNPSRDNEEIHRLHDEDESTKWFGVAREVNGRPNFEDYGRYATLMSHLPSKKTGERYPQLVSFIGITNAGKSTLIKMLVNHNANLDTPEDRRRFPSPIVGSIVNDSVPTSGDVHLYADPSTHSEQLPMLYADCEGFEGGERMPMGARTRKLVRGEPDTARPSTVNARTIQWANSEEARQREYAVTVLYPRLLYTFSDCVVFVLRNPKTFQSAVLTKLLDWGVAALEKSLNQPALPHCIVALNGTDPSVDEQEWDIEYATRSLLSTVSGALDQLEGVPRFRELADYWRSLGKNIETVEDLILRYYSSFRVVRVPSKPRYMAINEQIGKLHGLIKSNCEESFRIKRRARMLTTADELDVYLQSGFDHFTAYLDIPFNFMAISLLRNPIKNDFGGHILQLCTALSSQQVSHRASRVMWLFEKLSVMLASCVLLDCARFRKGRVDELFSNYEKFFDYAMGEYMELHYPCSYVNADGSRRCKLVRARHAVKGHQDDKGIIAAGDYEAAFDTTVFLTQWKGQLRAAIEDIHRDFTYELEQATTEDMNRAMPEVKIALDLHSEYMNQFFEAVGPAASICSHATCFCCLMDVPEHPLPCGHVLCTRCIKAYGDEQNCKVTLPCCPLHREATQWARPAVIRFTPPGAGARVLVLDGGGIRGIVQLEVLRGIERALHSHVPVQAFFDLMVGTGTGALLVTALSIKDRSVESCIDTFSAICEHAFTPRLKGIPIISQVAQAIGSGPKYKTKPLYAALKTTFGDEDDLFGCSGQLRPDARIALATASVTGRESIVLASYRRPDDPAPIYAFERPHEPEMEVKTWEGVAAAMATPTHFRPFEFRGKTYLDGTTRTGNPCFLAERERQLIWPDVNEPDLFLSLGTGQNRINVLQKMSSRAKELASSSGSIFGGQTGHERKKESRWKPRRTEDVLECEIAWSDFRHEAVKDRSEAKGRRYIRFNPDLDREPPATDSKSDIHTLQLNVRKRLNTPHRLTALRNVAHRLVGSCFYFDLHSKGNLDKAGQVCAGTIRCRFEEGSQELSGLGAILKQCRTEEFEPYFLVKPNQKDASTSFRVPLTWDILLSMTQMAAFQVPTVYITILDDAAPTAINLFLAEHDGLEPDGFAISGFPRVLLGDTGRPTRDLPTSRTGSEKTASLSVSDATSSAHPYADSDSNSIRAPSVNFGRKVSEDTLSDMHAKFSSLSTNSDGVPKMSLADYLTQQRNASNGGRSRTNRFWTYIGNTHIAQHPELYTAEEVAKFTAGSERDSMEETPRESMGDAHDTSGFPHYEIESGDLFPRQLGDVPVLAHTPSTMFSEASPEIASAPSFREDGGSSTPPSRASQPTETGSLDSKSATPTTTAHIYQQLLTSKYAHAPLDGVAPVEQRTERGSIGSSGGGGGGGNGEDLGSDKESFVSAPAAPQVQIAPTSPVRQVPPPLPRTSSLENHTLHKQMVQQQQQQPQPLQQQPPQLQQRHDMRLPPALDTALPDQNSIEALDKWLLSQKKSASDLRRKLHNLNAVSEEDVYED